MRRTGWLVIVAVMLIAVVAAGYWRYQYPYGRSHCCDLLLYRALVEYANDHNGVFPVGEETPEASLSLLYHNVPWVDANLLRGKTVPESVVQGVFDRGELLGPETCGWHYIEGLNPDDDPRLAIFWDKAGLSHSGQRQDGFTVMLVNGERKHIPSSDWPAFKQQQRQLLAERTRAVRVAQ